MESRNTASKASVFDRIFDNMERVLLVLACLSLFVMMAVSTLDSMGRYILNMPIPGVLEITEEYFMIAVIFLPLSYVYFRGGQIRIEMLEQYFPQKVRYYLDKFNKIVAFILFLLIAIASSRIFIEAVKIGEISNCSLGYPLAASYAMVPLGSGFLCIRALQMLWGKMPETNDLGRENIE